jgi:hypothetical protein
MERPVDAERGRDLVPMMTPRAGARTESGWNCAAPGSQLRTRLSLAALVIFQEAARREVNREKVP